MNQIVSYNEKDFMVLSLPDTVEVDKKGLGLQITSKLLYKDNTEVLGFRIKIVYDFEGKQVMLYKAMFTILVKGWKDFIQKKPSDEEISSFTLSAWMDVIGFARGVIYSKAAQSGSNIASYFLPSVDKERFAQTISSEKIEEK